MLEVVPDVVNTKMPPCRFGMATCLKDVATFVMTAGYGGDTLIGVDTETDAQPWPMTNVVGISVYSREAVTEGSELSRFVLQCADYPALAMYIPLNYDWPDLKEKDVAHWLQILADGSIFVAHHWGADGPLFSRMGIHPKRIKDTYLLSNTLQAREPGLKDQILAYGLEKYTEVSHYLQLVANRMGIDVDTLKVRGKEDSSLYSFGQFDPAHDKTALLYACRDAQWTRELLPLLEEEHDALVGGKVNAELIRDAQDRTCNFLASATSEGYVVDLEELQCAIEEKTTHNNFLEDNLRGEVKNILGW